MKQSYVHKPVRHRLLIPMAIILILNMVGFNMVLFKLQREHINRKSQLRLENATDELNELQNQQISMLAAIEEIILRDTGIGTALKAGNRQQLLSTYNDIYAKLRDKYRITHFYFHRSDRQNLLRIHKPDKHGDLINRFTACKAERTGKTASGVELGPLGTFTLRVVMPIFDRDTLAGYIEVGKEIEDILVCIHDRQGVEVTAVIRKSALNRENWESGMKMLGRESDWNYFPNDVIIYSSMDHFPNEAGQFIDERQHIHGDPTTEIVFDGKTWRVLVDPLIDASNADVGDLIVFSEVSGDLARFNRLLIMAIGSGVFFLIVLISFLYVFLGRIDKGISERADNLIKSENFQRTLTETSPDFIIVLDVDGTIRRVNRPYPGLPMEEVMGNNVFDLVPPDFHDAFKKAFQKALNTGQLQTIEIMVKFPDENHYFLNRLNPVSITDEKGLIVHIATDITERRLAEQSLKESEEKYRRLTENAKAMIYRMSLPSGKYEYVSPVAREITGYSPEEFYADSKIVYKIIHPDWQNYLNKQWDNLLKGNVPRVFEFVIIHKSGEERWIQQHNTPIRDNKGNLIAIESIVTDITDQKVADVKLQKTLHESERMNKLMNGREQRVIEMKKEVNALMAELGRESKYRSVES